MKDMTMESCRSFVEALGSASPTPGGGGTAALIGALGSSLASMVAALTTGKKKYAQYQNRIDELLPILEQLRTDLLLDIQKDADAFYPLSQAYSLDKNTPDYDKIMEEALLTASNAPMKIVEDVSRLVPILEELEQIGSRLAVSDVAVAAAACSAALKGAVMNIYINTKSMKNRETAETMNKRAKELSKDGVKRCDKVYEKICAGMM